MNLFIQAKLATNKFGLILLITYKLNGEVIT